DLGILGDRRARRRRERVVALLGLLRLVLRLLGRAGFLRLGFLGDGLVLLRFARFCLGLLRLVLPGGWLVFLRLGLLRLGLFRLILLGGRSGLLGDCLLGGGVLLRLGFHRGRVGGLLGVIFLRGRVVRLGLGLGCLVLLLGAQAGHGEVEVGLAHQASGQRGRSFEADALDFVEGDLDLGLGGTRLLRGIRGPTAWSCGARHFCRP